MARLIDFVGLALRLALLHGNGELRLFLRNGEIRYFLLLLLLVWVEELA